MALAGLLSMSAVSGSANTTALPRPRPVGASALCARLGDVTRAAELAGITYGCARLGSQRLLPPAAAPPDAAALPAGAGCRLRRRGVRGPARPAERTGRRP